MPFTIVRQDITKMKVDAIVNAANTDLAMGSGVCGAIFQAAGPRELQAACDKLSPIRTGEAVITPGFSLPSRYVIHAAGPVYRHYEPAKSEMLLQSVYSESLRLAALNHCKSIAFPLISSGVYGYPKEEALQVATSAIRDFLRDHDLDVYLVVFDKESFSVSEKLLGEVRSYVDERYVEEKSVRRGKVRHEEEETLYRREMNSPPPEEMIKASFLAPSPQPHNLEDWVNQLDEPFSSVLVRLIDMKGRTDVEVYKRANLDRKLFSKIRGGKGYKPGKRTVLALAVALELDLSATEDLLRCAGYALSRSQKCDVIVEYSADRVKKMIERQKIKYGWEFIFLGANIDAVETAARYGIAEDRAQNFCADSEGVGLNYCVMSDAVASFRECSVMPKDWNARIKKDFRKRGNA